MSSKQKPTVTFGPDDGEYARHPHNDALVISTYIQNYMVNMLLVDDGSMINALS